MIDIENPRAILLENIQIKSFIPEDVAGKVFNAPVTNTKNKCLVNNNPLALIKQTMDSPYVNLAESERIATAILEGKDIPMSTSGKVLHQPHKLIKKSADLRHTAKLNFLELTSGQAPVHEINVSEEFKASRSIERPNGYVWAGQFLEALPQTVTLKHQSEEMQKSESKLKVRSIAQAQALSRKYVKLFIGLFAH